MAFLVEQARDGGLSVSGRRVTPMGKVVRRAEYAAFVDARGLVERAHADAGRIVDQAWEMYRVERERGYADGLQAAHADQAAALLRIGQETSTFLKDVESDITGLVVASLRKIVADFDASERVLAVVRSGLALLRQQKQILLRVHTDDAVFVRQHLQGLLSQFPGVDYVDIVTDDRFPRGACRIESPIGTIETSLDKQLDVLQQALEKNASAVVDAKGGNGNVDGGRNDNDAGSGNACADGSWDEDGCEGGGGRHHV